MHLEIFLKIILSSMLGGLLGAGPGAGGKGPGIRPAFLIAAVSTFFSILGNEVFSGDKIQGSALVTAAIIAGAAVFASSAVFRSGTPGNGLLSGASLWAASGIGISVGLGFYLEGFLTTILFILILGIFSFTDHRFRERNKLSSYSIRIRKRAAAVTDIKRLLMECGINDHEWSHEKIRGGFRMELTISTSGSKETAFIEKLMEMDDIDEVRSDSL